MKKIAISLYVAVTVALLIWGFYQAIYIAPADDRLGGQGEPKLLLDLLAVLEAQVLVDMGHHRRHKLWSLRIVLQQA